MQFALKTLAALLTLTLFHIVAHAADLAADAPLPVFTNPGVYHATVNGFLYEWIPTEQVNFDIRPDGRVRILAPKSKRSFDGQTDCQRFLYDHLHRRLEPAEGEALFGEGLRLSPGSYGFAIQWVNAKTYDQVRADPWNLTCNPKTYQHNSAQLDYFYLSIVPSSQTKPPAVKAGRLTEVTLPRDLLRASWLPHYQVLPTDLHLPPDKGFGVTRILWDIPLDQVYKKVTHIQAEYQELDNVPASRKWITKQALDNHGQLASNEWLIAHHPVDRNFITTAEMDENFGSRGVKNHAERAQEIFKGIYQRMEREAGVTSPNQTRLYDDYFSALEGYNNECSFLWYFDAARLKLGLSDQTMARKMNQNGKLEQECRYFTTGAYQYRNWLENGYLDSFPVCPEGMRIYNEIYNYERKFTAIADRKVLKFSWANAEGVNSTMYRHGVKSRLHFEGGDILRTDVVEWPFHMMLDESFWALLLGNDFVLWHSNIRLVQDPLAFRDSGATGAGKTQWQPTGGKAVDYNPKDPAEPQRIKSPKGEFPSNPHLGESGAFAGAWLVGQITAESDRTSKSIAYCPFEYQVNGGPLQSGYEKSNDPVNGKLGNAQLSRYGTANYAQDNIVSSYVAKKPICIYSEGKDGAALIFHNVYTGLTSRTEVKVQTKTGPLSFTVNGNDLHIFLVK